jgi:hypothetical protein
MRLLATALPAQPMAMVAGLAVATVAALVVLLRRRRTGAVVLVLGAGAALLPAALVSDAWWFGFDRYLYLPAILLIFAVVSAWPAPNVRGESAAAASNRLALVGLVVCWCGVAGWGLWRTARAYSGPQAFAIAMTDERPEDPSGWLWLARDVAKAGFVPRARAVLAAMPADPEGAWPPIVSHELATLYLGFGQPAEAAAVVERAAAAWPAHVNLRFDLMALRMSQGRFDEGLDLAKALLVLPAQRAPTRQMLEGWSRQPGLDPAARARCAELLTGSAIAP